MTDEAARTAAIVAAVEVPEMPDCHRCQRPISRRELVVSHAMGFKHAPVGAGCLAGALGLELDALRAEVRDVILRRECWSAGWDRAVAIDGADAAWDAVVPRAAAAGEDAPEAGVRVDARWDAGDMACGDLLFDLRLRIRALEPGQVLEVIARDPSAPIDMPAWCRVTGHPLVHGDHPTYRIRRKP